MGEWEFEVLKPRYSEQNGRAIRIDVTGEQVEGVVETIDSRTNIITIMRLL
jgi:hypothetical protein